MKPKLPKRKIVVLEVDTNMTNAQLRDHFKKFGPVGLFNMRTVRVDQVQINDVTPPKAKKVRK